jgi:hypothetical protein
MLSAVLNVLNRRKEKRNKPKVEALTTEIQLSETEGFAENS